MNEALPIIDVSALVAGDDPGPAAEQIAQACRDSGFFYITGHGVPADLMARLDGAAREFFALPEPVKMQIAMARGGRAWRGFFPVGDELTSGRPDRKEGVYFGVELPADDPKVRAGLPLHGANLFPAQVPELRKAVLDYIEALTGVAQAVLRGVAVSLDLDADYFAHGYTADPTVLFRIFHYPPEPVDSEGTPVDSDTWGVGEHTDYGLLTILHQDDVGGLEVHTPGGWVDAPPVPGSFVCNLGDMLERMTGGAYRSTPHRVRNRAAASRVSAAFFFDPAWDAEIVPVPVPAGPSTPEARPRWDHANPFDFEGTYGDYLLTKVAKVFPDLSTRTLDP
jgi:isopenicillin N synthase-like dioxygenase